jgi:CheY-like chemotaxis protein
MMEVRQILVVDDEPDLVALYEAWLDADYDVLTATDGETAVAAVEGRSVDVVLLDRQMPTRSGDEVLRELRARGHDCPVGLVTATRPDAGTFALPFDDYVVKPMDRETLTECVGRLATMIDCDAETRRRRRAASKLAVLGRLQSDAVVGDGPAGSARRELGTMAGPTAAAGAVEGASVGIRSGGGSVDGAASDRRPDERASVDAAVPEADPDPDPDPDPGASPSSADRGARTE